MQWISVKDKMPKDHEKVLTCDKNGNMHIFSTSKELNEIGCSFGIGEYSEIYYAVTHWIPLPQPPKGGGINAKQQ